MNLPDRIRIELDGNKQIAGHISGVRAVDLDTGEIVTKVTSIRIDMDAFQVRAIVVFRDPNVPPFRPESIARTYYWPDLDLRLGRGEVGTPDGQA